MATQEAKVKDLETKSGTPDKEEEGNSTVANEEAPEVTGGTKDYILTDALFYHLENGRMKRYRKGQKLTLTENEAKTLLAEPRPSVREVS